MDYAEIMLSAGISNTDVQSFLKNQQTNRKPIEGMGKEGTLWCISHLLVVFKGDLLGFLAEVRPAELNPAHGPVLLVGPAKVVIVI